MKSKKLLYAFAGLVFVGGLAFAFSSTDMFKGTFEFDFTGVDPSAVSGVPVATMAPTSTGAATLFDLRWDSDLKYDETSNVFSALMCIDDGTGDPSYTEDVLVDYYVYNDATGSAVQSGVYTVTDIHRDSSMSSGDCVDYDLFTVDEGQLDDSEFRVSIALRFSDDADSSNDGRGKDLSDSDVVSGTNLLVQSLDYSDADDLLTVDMCYEGDEPDSSLRYNVELDYSGSSTIGTNFPVASWGTGDCYTMNYLDFVSTYEASGETEVSVSVDTLDVISVSDGDDLADNVLLETVDFPESDDASDLNLELVEAYIDGTALYATFNLEDSSGATHDFYFTHSIDDQSNDVAFSMSDGQSMDGLIVGDLTSFYKLDASIRDGGDALMMVTLDIDDSVEEVNEGDNSLKIELSADFLDSVIEEDADDEEVEEYDYEETAREILYDGYGLKEDEIEKEMMKLVEEAVLTEMPEQEFLDALSLIAEDALEARAAEEEAAEQKEEEERREEEERAADAAEEEMRMSEEEIDDLLDSLKSDYEGKQGLDEAMEELKKQAMDGEWSSDELEENARSKFESLEEEEEDRGEDKRDETASADDGAGVRELSDDEQEAIEVAVDSIDLGSGKRDLSADEEEKLEEALEEAVAEGSIDESDIEEVVQDFESETDEDDDLTEMLAALEAAIAAANSAANSASSAASAASSAAHSASNSGGSSSGAQDVVVNIDLGDYLSDSQSSTAATSDSSSSGSAETSTEVASDSPFSDVEEGTWYGDAMIALNEAGIMEGSNGKAYPWEYGNRAELVVLVMRAFYDESVLSKMNFDHEFEDVSATKWYAMYLSAAVDFDILEAKDEFRPSAPMTRAEFVTVLVRAANQVCMSCEADFSDINQGDWYYRAIATALSADLVSGYEDGSFKPNSNINRAQVASVLYKALEAGWLD